MNWLLERPRLSAAAQMLFVLAVVLACGGSKPEPSTPASEENQEGQGGNAGSANGGTDPNQATSTEPAAETPSTPPPTQTPDPGEATSYGAPSGGSCSDNGASCSSDTAVASAKQECASSPPSQRPCYCAAALLYQCYIARGCYAEAGAATSVTLGVLQAGANDENQKAASLGAPCF